jgi:uncharacterized membrane protein
LVSSGEYDHETSGLAQPLKEREFLKSMQSKIVTSFLMAGVLFTRAAVLHAEQTNTPAATAPGANPAPPGQGGNAAQPPRMRPLPGAPMGGPMSVLTEEQLASYKKNITDKQAEMMELNSRRQAARQEISHLVLSPKLDENLIRQKIMDEAKIEADLAIMQAKAFAEIQPPLSDEQLEKLKETQAPRMPMIRPGQTPPAAPSTTATNRDQSGAPGKQ